MPLYVLFQQGQKTEEELREAAKANTAMVCVDGQSTSMRSDSLWNWITTGPAFRCTDWETPEGRAQRAEERKERELRTREEYKREQRGW